MKTCKECKYYNAEGFHCEKFECMAMSYDSCPDYEAKPKRPTKGDMIRQMSDAELAMIFVCKMDSGVFYSHFTGGFYASQEKAIASTMAELKKEWKK